MPGLDDLEAAAQTDLVPGLKNLQGAQQMLSGVLSGEKA